MIFMKYPPFSKTYKVTMHIWYTSENHIFMFFFFFCLFYFSFIFDYYDIKTFSECKIFWRQIGHVSIATEHEAQHTKCLHGKKMTSTSFSKHTLHRDLSRRLSFSCLKRSTSAITQNRNINIK